MSFTSTTTPARGGAQDEYEQFCVAFRRVCGIDLLQYKRGQMERRIRSFVSTRHGALGLVEYAETLKADKDELNRFLDRVTINVSQLWRNPEQWEVLEERILPDLAESGRNRVRCWSAGSSYGAEGASRASSAVNTPVRARSTMRASMSVPRIVVCARGIARRAIAAKV